MGRTGTHISVGLSFPPPAFSKKEAIAAAFPSKIIRTLNTLSVDLPQDSFLLDTQALNDIADLDRYFSEVNAQLGVGQYLIGHADHLQGYNSRIFSKGSSLAQQLGGMTQFALHRVMPRLRITRKLHRLLFGPRGRRMSKTEVLGRLVYHGFDIDTLDYESGNLCYKAIKRGEKMMGCTPSFGPLIKLDRMVKGGKMAKIYKLRTMHPYSEFIQEYVYHENDLDDGGKIRDDFRVTEEGSIFRKYFLDELPMLINLIKGDIKLVGVRPLSAHYFSLYTEAMRRKRRAHKPGLLPPYYSEESRPSSLEEIMVSEMRYLIKYEKNPIATDIRYFFKIWKNLLLKKLRSK